MSGSAVLRKFRHATIATARRRRRRRRRGGRSRGRRTGSGGRSRSGTIKARTSSPQGEAFIKVFGLTFAIGARGAIILNGAAHVCFKGQASHGIGIFKNAIVGIVEARGTRTDGNAIVNGVKFAIARAVRLHAAEKVAIFLFVSGRANVTARAVKVHVGRDKGRQRGETKDESFGKHADGLCLLVTEACCLDCCC